MSESASDKAGHKHPEAHCLMQYQCESCKDIEIIWNSRNGVTPFIVRCRKCGGSMQHIRWHADTPMPNLRMFVDQTPERLRESLRQYVDREWDNDHGARRMSDRWQTKQEAVEDLFKDWWKEGEGQPAIVEILDDGVHEPQPNRYDG